MKTLEDYKKLIETKLDIINCLTIRDNKIIPNSEILNRKIIKENSWEDLFSYDRAKLVFEDRMRLFVYEITNGELLTGFDYFKLRGES
jgi:hypothetical protein